MRCLFPTIQEIWYRYQNLEQQAMRSLESRTLEIRTKNGTIFPFDERDS